MERESFGKKDIILLLAEALLTLEVREGETVVDYLLDLVHDNIDEIAEAILEKYEELKGG